MTELIAILGPSAAGKTRMGVEVAEALAERGRHVEIVSCDSMAVYRGLDILFAKPTAEERSRVPHHLLDVVEPDADFTVVEYRSLARSAIADIARRGAVPLLVGGSGLYFRAVVDDLAFAPTSSDLRERLAREDPERLYARLRVEDPASADGLDPRNVRRVVRAVEVLELTGRRPSELRGDWERPGRRYVLTAIGLTWDREDLLDRVEERVGRQIEAGVVDEVRHALAGTMSRTSRQALGVKEIARFVAGTSTLEEATGDLVRNSKAFVRRQLSWFRADERIEWVNVSEAGWEDARRRIVDRCAAAVS